MASFIRSAFQALPDSSVPPESVARILVNWRAVGEIPRQVFEQALLELEELGGRQPCRGGFWRTLEKTADYMGLPEAQARYHSRFREALRALADQARDRP